GIGVFVANILTIESLSELRSQDVKAITDADDEIILNPEEKRLLAEAEGRVLLFYLSGPMIFGVAKAISREHTAMEDHDVLIVDLSDVPKLGVTSSLALENAIKEACEKGRQVFIVGATGSIKRRLERFGILALIPTKNLLVDRTEALRQAVTLVKGENVKLETAGSLLN
ncbi:MAG: SulP family inorganic anion transporter, partial [Merismopedia sp. SIO2A8]|nr:SulP family inorganic anion transporter [Merismopedia sp. SIO2A8]